MRLQPQLAAALLLVLSATSASADDAPAPLPADEAARTMIVPDGFNVTVFAAEPDVRQPVGFCFDDLGRLWVAEAYSYPHHNSELPASASASRAASAPGLSAEASQDPGADALRLASEDLPRDRILIFEDSDNDGRFDQRTVFFEGLNYVTGVEFGFGGAWVMSPPYFLFIPDRDRDDVPDAAPQVLLEGFGNHANSHNLANGFAWGPDGWLYATHGRTNWSTIGKPETPEAQRQRFDGGVWRYHPTRHIWEPYCDGTTNPWGIDWDDWGEAFISNCVNPHLFHVIPGAHYEPWRDRESSRYAYQRIATIADHLHYLGGTDFHAGIGTAEVDALGGGHAHCGVMVYLGDNWPAGYRNTAFLHNIHGKRINNDVLKRSGSGYVASHAPDILRSQDSWMMGVTLQYGPDGSVFLLDWSDTGECHSTKNTQRQTGRIYRMAYGTPEPRRVDVTKLSNRQLVELQLHPNDWFVRHARRVLQERLAEGQDVREAIVALHEMLRTHPEATRRLRAVWTLHALAALSDDVLIALLDDPDEHVQAWAVTLLCEDGDPPPAARQRFILMASGDSTPLVRLHLSSSLQRLPLDRRWTIAGALIEREEDAADQNLPLMSWYAIEPLIEEDASRFMTLATTARIPLVRQHIARRVAGHPPQEPSYAALIKRISETADSARQRDLLRGMAAGLEGTRRVRMPPLWPDAYQRLIGSEEAECRDLATQIGLIFDDPDVVRDLSRSATNAGDSPEVRRNAIQRLVQHRLKGFETTLLSLVADPAVRSPAIRGLAEYEHPETAQRLLAAYSELPAAERQDVLQTLAGRREWAAALLEALAAGTITRGEVSAYTARQIRSLGDETLTKRLTELWGEIRTTPADKAKWINTFKPRLTAEALAARDPAAGRVVFRKLCANCHKLFDDGTAVGPDLTGSQRRNLDYLLENILDPSASVSRDYQMEVIVTDAGRVITGMVVSETDAALTVATTNERIVVPVNEIDVREPSKLSLMPDGLLQNASVTEMQNLMHYLASDQQVPLP
jgi:putative membrane-bound dehydrogenase-like protein